MYMHLRGCQRKFCSLCLSKRQYSKNTLRINYITAFKLNSKLKYMSPPSLRRRMFGGYDILLIFVKYQLIEYLRLWKKLIKLESQLLLCQTVFNIKAMCDDLGNCLRFEFGNMSLDSTFNIIVTQCMFYVTWFCYAPRAYTADEKSKTKRAQTSS